MEPICGQKPLGGKAWYMPPADKLEKILKPLIRERRKRLVMAELMRRAVKERGRHQTQGAAMMELTEIMSVMIRPKPNRYFSYITAMRAGPALGEALHTRLRYRDPEEDVKTLIYDGISKTWYLGTINEFKRRHEKQMRRHYGMQFEWCVE